MADVFKAEPDNWENYFEYYNSDFKDYFYTFDSMDDLYSQLSAAGDADPRNLKQRGMELMKKIGEASLRDWSKNLSI